MSAFQRVIDYMQGMPDAANHKEIFYEKFLEREGTRAIKQLDGVQLEKKLLGPGERNVVGSLNMQVKFTLNNFYKGFSMTTLSVARTSDSSKDRIERGHDEVFDFLPTREWALLPATASVVYSTRETALNILDREQRSIVLSCCNSLGAEHTYGLGMVAVTEKLNLPTDMRHIFTKMYLTLMDYNLAVTSKCTEMGVATTGNMISYPMADDALRLSAVLRHDIVIDTNAFTSEELGLILLAGQAYPSVWYAGDNIYNACQMEEDSVAFISSGEITVDKSLRWGSPDRLYNMMWSIAAKFGAVDCMARVISEMRGKPKMMSDILKRTDITAVASDMPLSRCLTKAFGDRSGGAVALSQYPGYMSTSISLVADLMTGMMFEASATCLVEELGGIGKALSGADPSTHKTFNGLLRDYGLDHANLQVNSLLTNWMSVAGSPVTWAFGRQLKVYLVKLASEIVNDIDIKLPPIVGLIPYMSSHYTTWGCSRGWRGKVDLLNSSKSERKSNMQQIASVAWLMGSRKVRPKVFRNTLSASDIVLGKAEYELQAQCKNGCTITEVAMWLGQDVGGRIDENEKVSSSLLKTEYAGTKCSLIYDRDVDKWLLPEPITEDYPTMIKQSMKGAVPEKEVEIRPVTFGGSPNPQGSFSYLKTMSNAKLNIEARKKYARMSPESEMFVTPYLLDGNRETKLQVERKLDVKEGEDIIFGEVAVPGDGQCAIHAVMEDLKMHGYVGTDSVNRAKEMFADELSTPSWHDANEIAAILSDYGMGLDLLDITETGDANLMRFGPSDLHRVGLVRRGGHFNAAKFGAGHNRFRLTSVQSGDLDTEQYREAMMAARQIINFNK